MRSRDIVYCRHVCVEEFDIGVYNAFLCLLSRSMCIAFPFKSEKKWIFSFRFSECLLLLSAPFSKPTFFLYSKTEKPFDEMSFFGITTIGDKCLSP